MKAKIFFALIFLNISPTFANKEPDFSDKQKNALKHIDLRISVLNDGQSCTKQAKNIQELKKCANKLRDDFNEMNRKELELVQWCRGKKL